MAKSKSIKIPQNAKAAEAIKFIKKIGLDDCDFDDYQSNLQIATCGLHRQFDQLHRPHDGPLQAHDPQPFGGHRRSMQEVPR